MIRQIVRDRASAHHHLVSFFIIRLVLGFFEYGILAFFVLNILDYPPLTSQTILIFCLALIPESISAVEQAYMMSHGQFGIPSISNISSGLFKLIAGAIAIKPECKSVRLGLDLGYG